MNQKMKNSLLNVAAELVVLPITAFVTVKLVTDKFNNSDTGKKVKAYAQQAGEEISNAAKKAAESEPVQNAKAKFEEISAKAGEKVKEYTDTATAKFEEFKDGAEEKMRGFADGAEDKVGEAKGLAEDRIESFADDASDKAEEFRERATERVQNIADAAEFKVEEFRERAEGRVETAADAAEEKVSRVQGELDKLFSEVESDIQNPQQ